MDGPAATVLVDSPSPAVLQAALHDVAFLVGHDVEAAATRAGFLLHQVRHHVPGPERTGLGWQAELVIADAAGRRGDAERLGVVAQAALAWADGAGDAFVAARAHQLLSTLHEILGDGGLALEHAVQGVERLPADAPAWVHGDHRSRLGITHEVLGDFDEARTRFTGLLRAAEAQGDQNLRLRTLNNLAYLELRAGRAAEAAALAAELLEHSRRTGLALSAAAWDTVAHVRMGAGRWAAAEAVLRDALADARLITEARDVATLHVNLARCLRHLGRFAEAAQSLAAAAAQCADLSFGEVGGDLVLEQCELAAATGDFEGAYRLHRRFYDLTMERVSAAKHHRARVLAAIYETTEARRAGEHYQRLAERDHLTGLFNRRYVEDVVPARVAASGGRGWAIALLDLDHFKRVNDTHSHQVGDEVLQQFARYLEQFCGPGEIAARLGGEEFLLLLRDDHDDDDDGGARVTVLRLLEAVRSHDWGVLAAGLRVTCSAGLVPVGGGGSALVDALAGADRNLYAAKRAGRDRLRSDVPRRRRDPR
ncbi:GGDEF domain-containing protein [Kineococcus sp. NBC_00420]|uniref:tetratricopeptide repeat-containing diguanylate cyclase n=1 Tax=unclassified Kineococcus TaxID=2621656 RepID=UPI002E236692